MIYRAGEEKKMVSDWQIAVTMRNLYHRVQPRCILNFTQTHRTQLPQQRVVNIL